MRDYAGQASAIENPLRQKFDLKLDRKRMLTQFSTNSDNFTVSFAYTRSSELIRTKMTSDKSNFVYDYDENGRLDSIGKLNVISWRGLFNPLLTLIRCWGS